MYRKVLVYSLLLLSSSCFAVSLPWLEKIDQENRLKSIHTITSTADVSVSDGLTYQTETLFHDHQRAVFKRVYKDRTVTQAVEGKYIWSFDGKLEKEMPEFIGGIIIGHQFHAQMLYFDRLYESDFTIEQGQFFNQKSQMIKGKAKGRTIEFHFDDKNQPLGFTLTPDEQQTIRFQFKDFRKTAGFSLPYHVFIDDGKRQFDYHFKTIKFNQGRIEAFRAPEKLINDEQRLLRLHRGVMDDHFFERTTTIDAMRGSQSTIVSQGAVYQMDREASQKGMKRIMTSRDHDRYDDLIRPQVTISYDGTLGWVIVQVQASGMRLNKQGETTVPLAFTSAWIELYQKQQGTWKMIGNVSNFKPVSQ